MKNPFTHENSNLSNIFHNDVHSKKVENLKVQRTEAFFCQLCFLATSSGSAAGAAALKSGQGPPGRGIAVRQFSPLRRREGPPPQPQTTRSGQKLPRFTVFCARRIFSHFSDLVV